VICPRRTRCDRTMEAICASHASARPARCGELDTPLPIFFLIRAEERRPRASSTVESFSGPRAPRSTRVLPRAPAPARPDDDGCRSDCASSASVVDDAGDEAASAVRPSSRAPDLRHPPPPRPCSSQPYTFPGELEPRRFPCPTHDGVGLHEETALLLLYSSDHAMVGASSPWGRSNSTGRIGDFSVGD
jgi:hypothetical protein